MPEIGPNTEIAMQGKYLLSAISGIVALCATTATFAIMSVPNGWYVEGNLGQGHLSNKSYGTGSTSMSGIGENVNIGYKFMTYVAMEMGYTTYPTTNIKSGAVKSAQDTHYSYDLAFRGILPVVDSGVEVFAKAGAQRINSRVKIIDAPSAAAIGVTSSNRNATGLYIGAGIQYYFWPEFAFVAQYQHAQGSNSTGNEDLYGIGLSYIVS